MVGPSRIAYGTVIPAGVICRQDVLEEGKLFVPPPSAVEPRQFEAGIYRGINRVVENNLTYIGNLWALKAWYLYVRKRMMGADIFSRNCFAGALMRIEEGLTERIKRLKELADKMPRSIERARAETGEDLPLAVQAQQRALSEQWPQMEAQLRNGFPTAAGAAKRESFLRVWEKIATDSGHINAIGALSAEARKQGTGWLQEIVSSAVAVWRKP